MHPPSLLLMWLPADRPSQKPVDSSPQVVISPETWAGADESGVFRKKPAEWQGLQRGLPSHDQRQSFLDGSV